MSQLELTKQNILAELRQLCAHCSNERPVPHHCSVRNIAIQVKAINGVPLIVNDEFRGILRPAFH
jgi:hypothetical protein